MIIRCQRFGRLPAALSPIALLITGRASLASGNGSGTIRLRITSSFIAVLAIRPAATCSCNSLGCRPAKAIMLMAPML